MEIAAQPDSPLSSNSSWKRGGPRWSGSWREQACSSGDPFGVTVGLSQTPPGRPRLQEGRSADKYSCLLWARC